MELSLFNNYREHAFKVADEAHGAQFRADRKTPYIVHPLEVERRVEGHIRNKFEHASPVTPDKLALTVLVGRIAALVHDVREDNPSFPLRSRLLEAIPAKIVDVVMMIVDLITHSGGDYLDYILRLKNSAHRAGVHRAGVEDVFVGLSAEYLRVALIVKEEDMNVNLDDIKSIPSSGRRKAARTKYLLAHYILFDRKPYALLPIRPDYAP